MGNRVMGVMGRQIYQIIASIEQWTMRRYFYEGDNAMDQCGVGNIWTDQLPRGRMKHSFGNTVWVLTGCITKM